MSETAGFVGFLTITVWILKQISVTNAMATYRFDFRLHVISFFFLQIITNDQDLTFVKFSYVVF